MSISTTDHIGGLLQVASEAFPDRIAVRQQEGITRTYLELDTRTNQLANALLMNGLHPGDRIAAWMEDCVEYIELYFAAAKAGLVIVPISILWDSESVRARMQECGVRLLFHTEHLRLTPRGPNDVPTFDCTHLDEFMADAPARPFPPPNDDAIFILAYTAGSTGDAKPAILTHRAVKALARSNAIAVRLAIASVGVVVGSLSMVPRITATLMSHIYVGGTVILLGEATVDEQIAAIEAEQATFTAVGSTRMYEFARMATDAPAALRSLRSVLHGGARANPDHLGMLVDAVGSRVVEGWGLTENAGGLVTATTSRDLEDPARRDDVLRSVGRPVPEALVRVVGPDGQRLPHDGESVGELVVRTPSLFSGYWERRELTNEVLRNGWFWTGDAGSIDRQGYVHLAGTLADRISIEGEEVHTYRLERVLEQVPGVAECAAFGFGEPGGPQAIGAAIVLHPGAATSAAQIMQSCEAALPPALRPTRVWFLDALPRSHSGQIMRHRLKTQLRKAAALPEPSTNGGLRHRH